jgi:hypothetical protein
MSRSSWSTWLSSTVSSSAVRAWNQSDPWSGRTTAARAGPCTTWPGSCNLYERCIDTYRVDDLAQLAGDTIQISGRQRWERGDDGIGYDL